MDGELESELEVGGLRKTESRGTAKPTLSQNSLP